MPFCVFLVAPLSLEQAIQGLSSDPSMYPPHPPPAIRRRRLTDLPPPLSLRYLPPSSALSVVPVCSAMASCGVSLSLPLCVPLPYSIPPFSLPSPTLPSTLLAYIARFLCPLLLPMGPRPALLTSWRAGRTRPTWPSILTWRLRLSRFSLCTSQVCVCVCLGGSSLSFPRPFSSLVFSCFSLSAVSAGRVRACVRVLCSPSPLPPPRASHS